MPINLIMYTLVIGPSRSPNYKRAVDTLIEMGGFFNGKNATLVIQEEMTAYERLFPLFRLNAFNWVNTSTYYKGKRVNPYRLVFLANLNRKNYFHEVKKQVGNASTVFTYYKREGNTFYFRNKDFEFSKTLKGKDLYDFVDQFDINDKIDFK